jgi:hypothetical protein
MSTSARHTPEDPQRQDDTFEVHLHDNEPQDEAGESKVLRRATPELDLRETEMDRLPLRTAAKGQRGEARLKPCSLTDREHQD